MHEMSYVVRVVNLALKKSKEEHIQKINKVCVSIGQMVGIEPYYMEKYYAQAIKDTALEGSVIECSILPVIAHCEDCGKEYEPSKENDYMCPFCGSGTAHTVQGREFSLTRIEGVFE